MITHYSRIDEIQGQLVSVLYYYHHQEKERTVAKFLADEINLMGMWPDMETAQYKSTWVS
jgi:hypothetical protein